MDLTNPAVIAAAWALTGAAAVLLLVLATERAKRRRARRADARLDEAARAASAPPVLRTGRTLEGVVAEIVDDHAVVNVDGGATLLLPGQGMWVERRIVLHEYEDGTWHLGPHPSWADGGTL